MITQITTCILYTYICNCRLKNFSFKEHSFVLELPKPLLLADVAVRLLLPPFDPLSPSCHTHGYQCPAPTPTAALEKEKGRRGDGGEGKELGTEAKEIMTGVIVFCCCFFFKATYVHTEYERVGWPFCVMSVLAICVFECVLLDILSWPFCRNAQYGTWFHLTLQGVVCTYVRMYDNK